jgi:hypothetical protein
MGAISAELWEDPTYTHDLNSENLPLLEVV